MADDFNGGQAATGGLFNNPVSTYDGGLPGIRQVLDDAKSDPPDPDNVYPDTPDGMSRMSFVDTDYRSRLYHGMDYLKGLNVGGDDALVIPGLQPVIDELDHRLDALKGLIADNTTTVSYEYEDSTTTYDADGMPSTSYYTATTTGEAMNPPTPAVSAALGAAEAQVKTLSDFVAKARGGCAVAPPT